MKWTSSSYSRYEELRDLRADSYRRGLFVDSEIFSLEAAELSFVNDDVCRQSINLRDAAFAQIHLAEDDRNVDLPWRRACEAILITEDLLGNRIEVAVANRKDIPDVNIRREHAANLIARLRVVNFAMSRGLEIQGQKVGRFSEQAKQAKQDAKTIRNILRRNDKKVDQYEINAGQDFVLHERLLGNFALPTLIRSLGYAALTESKFSAEIIQRPLFSYERLKTVTRQSGSILKNYLFPRTA